ncbi:hypothetical protein [Rothia uropygialis]|nr:hypothetical protein [Kocuria sp. 36]
MNVTVFGTPGSTGRLTVADLLDRVRVLVGEMSDAAAIGTSA